MLDQDTRTAVLKLKALGHGRKKIAKDLDISSRTVRDILTSGRQEVPVLERPEQLEPHGNLIVQLYAHCEGNLVRVHEELKNKGVDVPYSTLTGFCRRHGIGVEEKVPAGQYHFAPGEEMQHDTSPHDVVLAGTKRRLQCASLVLHHSRMVFAQVYPTFNRFYCKVFLTEALQYFGGAAARCMIDNTHVVISHGTGHNAVVAPEMAAFALRFGFTFKAHAVGDANRSAVVERSFHTIENNFYPGRTFQNIPDTNGQLRQWCDKLNGSVKRHIKAKPIELFQTEVLKLKPLPLHIPEVYAVHLRAVDLEGYVSLHAHRYSVPAPLIGTQVRIHEAKDTVRIFQGHILVVSHARAQEGDCGRTTLPEHHDPARWRKKGEPPPPLHEESVLFKASPVYEAYVVALRQRLHSRAVRPIRALYQLFLDYPQEPIEAALKDALLYGLFDLARLERMILKNVAGDYFRLSPKNSTPSDEDDDE